jgi:hypothetical protein
MVRVGELMEYSKLLEKSRHYLPNIQQQMGFVRLEARPEHRLLRGAHQLTVLLYQRQWVPIKVAVAAIMS